MGFFYNFPLAEDAKPRIGMNRAPSRIQCISVSLAIEVHDRQRMVRAKIIKVEGAYSHIRRQSIPLLFLLRCCLSGG
jgi:hypothetical protein